MSDRIAVMNQGRVLQLGAPVEIYERPVSRFVADFIGEANVLPGALLGVEAAFVAIRPERVGLDPAGTAGLPGQVVEITYLGATTLCSVALQDGPTVKIDRGDLPPSLARGQAVTCLFPPDALLPLED